MHAHTQRGKAHVYRRMPRRQRLAVYATCAALWVSGVLWLILDQFCAHQEQFGRTPHPLEAPLLLLHGILAIASAYLLGWVSARHVLLWWTAGLRRTSGAVFAASMAILGLTGFALFFLTSDRWQRVATLSHDVLGVAIVLFALQHWLLGRRGQTAV
ncbi:MAG TPA: hypothetical protein VGR80_00315 [Steroidobacteraceae bacterium]|nr:hypothetical protein [Gammaproteobacteria bacterium]HEV2284455.1 hypothetical protein [Steroidobacteraceae bacterium]